MRNIVADPYYYTYTTEQQRIMSKTSECHMVPDKEYSLTPDEYKLLKWIHSSINTWVLSAQSFTVENRLNHYRNTNKFIDLYTEVYERISTYKQRTDKTDSEHINDIEIIVHDDLNTANMGISLDNAISMCLDLKIKLDKMLGNTSV